MHCPFSTIVGETGFVLKGKIAFTFNFPFLYKIFPVFSINKYIYYIVDFLTCTKPFSKKQFSATMDDNEIQFSK